MMKVLTARVAACVLFVPVALSLPLSMSAHAADGDRIIWSPTKTGDNAYKLRMGAGVSGRIDASGGAEVSVSASPTGKIQNAAPFGLWGLFSRKTGEKTARTTAQDVNIAFSAKDGAGNIGVSSTRRWIATRSIDIESRRSLNIRCNAYEKHCGDTVLAQSARISAVGSGTALVAQGTLASGKVNMLDSVGIEQTFGTLSLGASVKSPGSTPRGVFTARYALNW